MLRNSLGLNQHCESQLKSQLGSAARDQSNSTSCLTTFKNIPPERVGLNGEYDHSGLAKRVTLAFRQSFDLAEVESLRVIQRGAVVVLLGKLPSLPLLTQMVNVALATSGAVDVEINGVSVIQSYRSNRTSSRSGGAESTYGQTAGRRAIATVAVPLPASTPTP
ncbi:MAG: phospholipid-binding protein [Leptolyngbyaceae cyanobacterium SL_5_14]|nr:phospholipid-binding protein [Leptolyngbyaceae cyanobacterium SL_5_14]